MDESIERSTIEKELRAQDEKLKIEKVFNPGSHVEREALAVEATEHAIEPHPPLSEAEVLDMMTTCGTSDRLEAYAVRMGTMICHWCGGPHMLRECTNKCKWCNRDPPKSFWHRL